MPLFIPLQNLKECFNFSTFLRHGAQMPDHVLNIPVSYKAMGRKRNKLLRELSCTRITGTVRYMRLQFFDAVESAWIAPNHAQFSINCPVNTSHKERKSKKHRFSDTERRRHLKHFLSMELFHKNPRLYLSFTIDIFEPLQHPAPHTGLKRRITEYFKIRIIEGNSDLDRKSTCLNSSHITI